MKKTRNSISYKVWHWFYVGGYKDIFNYIMDGIMVIVLLAVVFVLLPLLFG